MGLARAAALPLMLAAGMAAPATAQTPAEVVQAELLPGWTMQDGHQMAGLSMQLAPDWKTYWRSPGQAGIPPLFDWSGSQNVARVKVIWPSPEVFHSNGMQTVGYHNSVVLPLEVTPKVAGKPVHLRMQMDMGVCKDVCMPYTLDLAADLAAGRAVDDRIAAALDRKPASGAEAGLTAISCDIEPISDGVRLTAHLNLPAQKGETVVFESGDPSIWVSESETSRKGGVLTSATELVSDSGAPFALDRSRLTVSVLGAGRSVEIAGCPAAP